MSSPTKTTFAAKFTCCLEMELPTDHWFNKRFFPRQHLQSLGGGQPRSECKNSQRDGIRWEENNKKCASRGGGLVKFKGGFPPFAQALPFPL